MTRFVPRLALIAGIALAAIGSPAAAQVPSQETLGEMLRTGEISQRTFENLILGTELTNMEARELTLNELVEIQWQYEDRDWEELQTWQH